MAFQTNARHVNNTFIILSALSKKRTYGTSVYHIRLELGLYLYGGKTAKKFVDMERDRMFVLFSFAFCWFENVWRDNEIERQ